MTTAAADPLFPGKQFISTTLEVLEAKTTMSGALTRRYLQRAAMAGIIIGLLYATNYAIIAAFDTVPAGDGTLRQLGRLIGAIIFGWALIFIYYSRSELLTSNMMIVCVGAYHRRTSWSRALRLLGLCLAGNLIGGLLVALLLRYSSIVEGGAMAEMTAAVEHKLAYLADGPGGWVDLLIRAILCNFCINLAMLLVYNGLIDSDLVKCLVMITAVFIFAFLGLEHSVANSVLFGIVGLRDGLDLAAAWGNVGIALVGNFLGGGLLIGFYYAWVNDDSRWRRG
ncbi:formate/nitrite transporter family protein [Cellulomonas fimi]|uniref:formate/nitrite transporter family protein n=1 Tax=Cellulomonas sp. RIT-PI-Y TaxID=3035297 RepID=UPI0021DB33D2